MSADFWAGRRVLVTGHTGFKGGWLCLGLHELGAVVSGVSLPPTDPDGFFDAVGIAGLVDSRFVDIVDEAAIRAVVREVEPEVVFHLAAQALVLPGVDRPVDTFLTNVVGTASVLAACEPVAPQAVLVVTSDKVYANDGTGRAFVESDPLGGGDPYSASKAATEIVVESWRHTYPALGDGVLATARAGNVIGGGDVAEGRLLPDVRRALRAGRPVELRHPSSTRPWQFVLEPVAGYLAYAERLAATAAPTPVPPALNFGPDPSDVTSVAAVADLAIGAWGSGSWTADEAAAGSAEASLLSLDNRLAGETLGWRPALGVAEAVGWTVDWWRAQEDGADLAAFSRAQLDRYRERTAW